MAVSDLTTAVRNAMNRRIEREGRAMKGTIQNGKLVVGYRQYTPVTAVDVNASEGKSVWAMPAENGKAVIVGA